MVSHRAQQHRFKIAFLKTFSYIIKKGFRIQLQYQVNLQGIQGFEYSCQRVMNEVYQVSYHRDHNKRMSMNHNINEAYQTNESKNRGL